MFDKQKINASAPFDKVKATCFFYKKIHKSHTDRVLVTNKLLLNFCVLWFGTIHCESNKIMMILKHLYRKFVIVCKFFSQVNWKPCWIVVNRKVYIYCYYLILLVKVWLFYLCLGSVCLFSHIPIANPSFYKPVNFTNHSQ